MERVRRTLLVTDLVDSTQLVASLGDLAAAALLARHDHDVREAVTAAGGREIDRTDGFLLVFDDPDAGSACAEAIHRDAAILGLRVRAGLHHAEVVQRANPAEHVARGAKPLEVEGIGKPVAARVMALARGGQTLCTAEARAGLSRGVTSIGWWRLKGVEEPVELFALGEDTRPPPDAPKAWRVVRDTDGGWKTAREVPHNLPAERDAFVGRDGDRLGLARVLDGGARLVTITGMGGTGKTRLAARFARERLGDRPGGAWWVDLADARDEDGVVAATARALDLRLGADPGEAVARTLRGRGSCLVVLDNFEQVVQHAHATVGAWLDRVPEATFLATSRQALQIPGEHVVPLGALGLDGEAQALFRTRALAADPAFRADDAAVARVVELLDGIPLAIELAVARVRVLGMDGLTERLRDRFALLAGARRGPARHATLRATIDWSWELLEPWERAALAMVSVFEAPFRLEAAEAVVDLGDWPAAPPPLDVVQALVDKSLLRVEAGRRAVREPWFGMYVSIREYAADKLRDPSLGRERATFERHLGWFAGQATPAVLEGLESGYSVLHRRHGDELPDVLAAWRRAVGGPRAAGLARMALRVLEVQGPLGQGAEVLERTLAQGGLAPEDELALRTDGAALLGLLGRTDEALAHLDHVVATAAGVAPRQVAVARGSRGSLLGQLGRRAEAAGDVEAALSAHRAAGDRRLAAIARQNLATATMESGAPDEARRELLAVLAEHEALGNRRAQLVIRSNLASLEKNYGHLDDAIAHAEAALALAREQGDRRREAIARLLHAEASAEAGRLPDRIAAFAAVREAFRWFGERRGDGVAAISEAAARDEAGDPDGAIELLREAAALLAGAGDRVHQAVAVANLGHVLLDQDRVAEARPALEHAVSLAADGPPRVRGAALGLLGLALARSGAPDEAAAAMDRAFGDLHAGTLDWAKALTHRGRVEALRGDLERARATLAEAEEACARLGAGADLGSGVASLRRAVNGSP